MKKKGEKIKLGDNYEWFWQEYIDEKGQKKLRKVLRFREPSFTRKS